MEYFILKPDGEQTGTFSIDQIRSMLNSGYIGLDTRYWHEGIADWQPIDRIEESVNFPEPSPDEPHPAPPPARRLTGSLARAIPSPHQQKQRAASLTSSKTLPTISVPPVVPEPVKVAEIPAPSRHVEHPASTNGTPAPATAESPVAPIVARPPRRPLLTWAQARTLSTLLLALAIIATIVASRHPAKSPLSKVTLTSRNDYVLVDQAAIKPFEDDMRNSSVAQSLQGQIRAMSDPLILQKLNIGLQQETGRHAGEVTQQYLHSGKAEVIEPGTYSTVAFLDDNGVLTAPRTGAPWVAILYKGNIVYAYQGADFTLVSQ
jgi:hypothetical protein